MSYSNHHWAPARENAGSPSGQSTGEGGGGGRHSLEMEPMISTTKNSSTGGSADSSKYHGKRTLWSSTSAGRLLLVGLACLAMMYLGFNVGGRDGDIDSGGGGPSPTPMVRKPPNSSGKDKVKGAVVDKKPIQESEMPNDDDEPSDEDEEDDKMLDGNAEEERDSDAEEAAGSSAGEENQHPELPESEDNAVIEDEAALEDDEDEDDDATQDFATSGDADADADADAKDADDDSTQDFDDKDKDGQVEPSPEQKLAQQNLEDDDNIVDDDAVSEDEDDGEAVTEDDDDDIDSVDEEDSSASDDASDDNAIAKKRVPGGMSKTPTMEYRIPGTVHKRFIKWSEELHKITEMEEYRGGEPKVNWEWHPRRREDRFPGVEERVSSPPPNERGSMHFLVNRAIM